MNISVRRYEGVTNPAEAARLVRDGFIPIISKQPGFVAYYWVDEGGGVMLSVNIFRSLATAMASNEVASEWVRANLAAVLPNKPRVENGIVVACKP
jgi:hypothetical protein